MGIFGQSSELDADIDLVTDEKNTVENWSTILDICDRASSSPKPALRSICRRLNDKNPHVQLQAITLLSACVSNCGRLFLLEVASRDFESELSRILTSSSCHRRVKQQLLTALQKWASEEFASDPQLSLIPCLCARLRQQGVYEQLDVTTVSSRASAGTSSSSTAGAGAAAAAGVARGAGSGAVKPPTDPNVVSSQQEQDDIVKAIELSMKESHHPTALSHTGLYPSAGQLLDSTSAASTPATAAAAAGVSMASSSSTTAAGAGSADVADGVVEKKVRALYDFEAVEDNELTFKTGEIIIVTNCSDPNWWVGTNQRGKGLIPANFVTADLSAPVETVSGEQQHSRKSVQFSDSVAVCQLTSSSSSAPSSQPMTSSSSSSGGSSSSSGAELGSSEGVAAAPLHVDGDKIERLLYLLNEADPTGVRADSDEMLQLEEQCLAMAPLIDQQLEQADRRHAQLTNTSSQLVDALNLYHQLMRDTAPATAHLPPPASGGPFYPPAAAATHTAPIASLTAPSTAAPAAYYQLPTQTYAVPMSTADYSAQFAQAPIYHTPGAAAPFLTASMAPGGLLPPGTHADLVTAPVFSDVTSVQSVNAAAAAGGVPWSPYQPHVAPSSCDPNISSHPAL